MAEMSEPVPVQAFALVWGQTERLRWVFGNPFVP